MIEPGFDTSSYLRQAAAKITGRSTPGALLPLSPSSQIRLPTEMVIIGVKNAMPPQKVHTCEIHTLLCPLCSFQPPS